MTLEQQLVNIAENTLKVYEAGKEENKEILETHEERIASVEEIVQKTEELSMKKGNGLYSIKMNQVRNNTADGESATAFGYDTKANGNVSIAGGNGSEANDNGALAIGYKAKANGKYSVALGHSTEANNVAAVALGYGTKASQQGQVVVGKYNADADGGAMGDNTRTNSLFIVGGGTSSTKRENAFEIFYDKTISPNRYMMKFGAEKFSPTQLGDLRDFRNDSLINNRIKIGDTYITEDVAEKLITISNSTAETWTFTLEDGSTVTKVVYVG